VFLSLFRDEKQRNDARATDFRRDAGEMPLSNRRISGDRLPPAGAPTKEDSQIEFPLNLGGAFE